MIYFQIRIQFSSGVLHILILNCAKSSSISLTTFICQNNRSILLDLSDIPEFYNNITKPYTNSSCVEECCLNLNCQSVHFNHSFFDDCHTLNSSNISSPITTSISSNVIPLLTSSMYFP